MNQNKIKWIVLFLLLVLPGIVYFYITKGSNNFVNLEVIGPEGHVIPPFKFINQFNDTVTNLDYEGSIYRPWESALKKRLRKKRALERAKIKERGGLLSV